MQKNNLVAASLLNSFLFLSLISCSQEAPSQKIVNPATNISSVKNTSSASTKNQIVNVPKRTFSPELVKAYVDGCEASGGTKTYCNCFIGKIKTTMNPDEFDKANQAFQAGGIIPSNIEKAMQSCQSIANLAQNNEITLTNQPTNGTGAEKLEVKLARHLKKIGAIMYGTYWCPYCNEQKQAFGSASSEILYIECDPQGTNPRPDLCNSAGVESYPTWRINGQSYSGSYTLKELAQISSYTDSSN